MGWLTRLQTKWKNPEQERTGGLPEIECAGDEVEQKFGGAAECP